MWPHEGQFTKKKWHLLNVGGLESVVPTGGLQLKIFDYIALLFRSSILMFVFNLNQHS